MGTDDACCSMQGVSASERGPGAALDGAAAVIDEHSAGLYAGRSVSWMLEPSTPTRNQGLTPHLSNLQALLQPHARRRQQRARAQQCSENVRSPRYRFAAL